MIFQLLLVFLQWQVLASELTPRSVGRSKQASGATLLTPAGRSNMTLALNQFSDRDLFGMGLFARQDYCDAGYAACSDGSGCCLIGQNCVDGGCCEGSDVSCSADSCYDPETENCCDDGTNCPSDTDCVEDGCCPQGQLSCDQNCYDPETEQCCEGGNGGVCNADETCCAYECCYSFATCGDDGYCTGITCTRTSTTTSTSFRIYATTITMVQAGGAEGGEDGGFSCSPMTVTNDEDDTLELGDDCGLTFSPATAAASTTAAEEATATGFARAARDVAQLLPRQTPGCYVTTTSVSTSIVSATTTVTQTVTEVSLAESFSCVPMSVTNAAGDELSLDDKCQLEFSAGSQSAGSAPTSGGGSGGGPPSGATRQVPLGPVAGICALAALAAWL